MLKLFDELLAVVGEDISEYLRRYSSRRKTHIDKVRKYIETTVYYLHSVGFHLLHVMSS
jgi:hypothetical protein